MKSHVAFSSRRAGLLATALTAAVLAGCASSKLPPAPALAATETYNYLIGPGDTVNIIVWRNPELSISVPVRPDGKISTPLVEDLPAIGRDSTSLARDIERELSKVIREPVVTVVVSEFIGPYSQQVRVVGEAARPQALPYVQQMTLLDVMIAVGGLTEYAAGNRATILRLPPVVKDTSDTKDSSHDVDMDEVPGEEPLALAADPEAPVTPASVGDDAVQAAEATTPAAMPATAVKPATAALASEPAPVVAAKPAAATDVKTVIDDNMREPVAKAPLITEKDDPKPEADAILAAADKAPDDADKSAGSDDKGETAAAEDAANGAPVEQPKPQQFSVRLSDLLKEGDVSANVEMLPGDILIIPQSWF